MEESNGREIVSPHLWECGRFSVSLDEGGLKQPQPVESDRTLGLRVAAKWSTLCHLLASGVSGGALCSLAPAAR